MSQLFNKINSLMKIFSFYTLNVYYYMDVIFSEYPPDRLKKKKKN